MCREAYAPIFETLPVNHVRSAVHQTRTCVPTVKSSVGEGDDADDEELEEAELSSESDSSGTARLVTRRGISGQCTAISQTAGPGPLDTATAVDHASCTVG